MKLLLLRRISGPRRRYRQTLIAPVEEPQDISSKDKAHILHTRHSCAVRLDGPVGDMKTRIHNRYFILLRRVLKDFTASNQQLAEGASFTKYLSVATDTRIKSSPTRTFSPSDLCLLAGWTVHQQASPWLCSCRPTSKASLSLLELVERQAKYWKCEEVSAVSCGEQFWGYHVAVEVSEEDGIAVE